MAMLIRFKTPIEQSEVFLRLMGYYQDLATTFAAVPAPSSDLLRGQPNYFPVMMTKKAACSSSKEHFVSKPVSIFHLPAIFVYLGITLDRTLS